MKCLAPYVCNVDLAFRVKASWQAFKTGRSVEAKPGLGPDRNGRRQGPAAAMSNGEVIRGFSPWHLLIGGRAGSVLRDRDAILAALDG